MNATIITCFESNESRVFLVKSVLEEMNYKVDVITTDFSHVKKNKRNNIPSGFKAVETKPYKKNLSVQRMLSHAMFSKDAFKLVEDNKPDLIWLCAPANSLIKEANIYKKNNENVKLIVDIIDMWPESLPVGISKDIIPFSLWRNIRKNNLSCADLLVTECDLYHEILKNEYKGRIETLYWAREIKDNKLEVSTDDNALSLVYLGSVNNIIDLEKIKNIIKSFNKKVTLHIVGTGEKISEMVSTMEEACEVVNHGVVLNEDKKSEIFKQCHAGINVYKENLYIGLTMKCIDYFAAGLPIINNIKGDTHKLVDEYNLGINVDSDLNVYADKLIELRKNYSYINMFYKNHFSKEAFSLRCKELVSEVMK